MFVDVYGGVVVCVGVVITPDDGLSVCREQSWVELVLFWLHWRVWM